MALKSTTLQVPSDGFGKEIVNETALFNQVKQQRWWYVNGLPYISSQTDFESSMPKLATKYNDEFCWATFYDPAFVAQLMYQGFLPMAAASGDLEVITPKLHLNRSIVKFANVPKPHGSTFKKSKKFEFSADTCFDRVAAGIVDQHGPSWFYPNLVKLFTLMNSQGERGFLNSKVRVHSFEVWQGDELVAGEAGYSVGKVYTSLSGFTTVDGAGTVQMYAMASHLKQLGFVLWDLGMQLGYKDQEFGAIPLPRVEFLQLLAKFRDDPIDSPVKLVERRNAKDFLALLRSDHEGDDVQMKLATVQSSPASSSATA